MQTQTLRSSCCYRRLASAVSVLNGPACISHAVKQPNTCSNNSFCAFSSPAVWAARTVSTRPRAQTAAAGQHCKSASRAGFIGIAQLSSAAVAKRQLTLGAALASATAGAPFWSRASSAPPGSGMATTAAAAAGSSSVSVPAGTGVVVVYVTAPSSEVGEQLASALVEQQLVACVNLVPGLTSVYTWKGKVEKDSEVLLIMKTQSHLLEQLTAKVQALHPYDEPEVIALPVVGGSSSYMQWVRDNTQAEAQGA